MINSKSVLSIGFYCTLAFSSDFAAAQVLIYEGFDSPAGENALDKSAGVTSLGWAAASVWSASGKDVAAGSMAYLDARSKPLRSAGNRVSTDTITDAFRALPATINSGTIWIGFIAKAIAPSPSLGYLGILLQSGSENRFFVGERFLSDRWSIERSNLPGQEADSTVLASVKSFLVVRIDFNQGKTPGNENAYLWVNPLLDSQPSTAQASATLLNMQSFDFNQVTIQGAYTSDGNELDELRIGSTFADVAPIEGLIFRNGFESAP